MFNTNQGNTRPNNYIQLSNTLFGKQSTPHNNSIQQNTTQYTPFNNNNIFNLFCSKQIIPKTQSSSQIKSQSQQSKSLFTQLKELLTKSNKPLCSGSNSAYNLCLNEKCSFKNPFICSVQQCNCVQRHQDCNQKRIDAFVRVLKQQQNTINKIQSIINNQVENLINEIVNNKNQIIQNIRSLKWLGLIIYQQHSFSLCKSDQTRQAQLNSIFCSTSKLNSKIFNSFWGLSKKVQNKININTLQSQIKKISTKFNTQIKHYFDEIYHHFNKKIQQNDVLCQKSQKVQTKQQLLNQSRQQFSLIQFQKKQIPQKRNFHWFKSLKSQQLKANNSHVKKIGCKVQNNLSLLSPSIDQMKGTNISWKIRINSLHKWIAMGICLVQVVKQNGFICSQFRSQLNHGCYMISTREQKLIHRQLNGGKTYYGIKQGDTILINYNKQNQALTFISAKNENSHIIYLDKLDKGFDDAYYICVGLGSIGDEIQIIGSINIE